MQFKTRDGIFLVSEEVKPGEIIKGISWRAVEYRVLITDYRGYRGEKLQVVFLGKDMKTEVSRQNVDFEGQFKFKNFRPIPGTAMYARIEKIKA